tara:strand:- start:1378 stop:1968 length:591 start_codon:yes stop_codon:yes gene_type:complete
MPLIVTQPAAVLAVTLQSLKDHLKVTDNNEDATIATYLGAAVLWAEDYTKRPFIIRTFKLYLDIFPAENLIELPTPLVTSVSSVKYYNASGTLTTLSSADYWTVTGDPDSPGAVILKSDAQWPTTQEDRPRAVEVTFFAGYGAGPELVPADVRQAIMLMAAHLFTNRLPYVTGTIVSEVPRTMEALLAPRRFYSLA